MIKFFRKIRQNLLLEGKTGKYLKYAIGEIVLVVIGILIALQINNWNEKNKQKIAETEFIKGLKNDLKQDKQFILTVIKTYNPKISAYSSLTNEFEKDNIELDSLLNIYFVTQRTFYPISGSFQAAVAGNEINKFENKEWTRLIIKLYNSTYDRLIDNGKIADERWEYLTKKYSHQRRIKKFGEMDVSELSSILDDMSYHHAQIRLYQDLLNKTIDEIDNILEFKER